MTATEITLIAVSACLLIADIAMIPFLANAYKRKKELKKGIHAHKDHHVDSDMVSCSLIPLVVLAFPSGLFIGIIIVLAFIFAFEIYLEAKISGDIDELQEEYNRMLKDEEKK